jgi:Arc/MetJ family transcription regulator
VGPLDKFISFVHPYAYKSAYDLEALMRTTLNIEEKLIHKAEELTGIHEKTHLVRLGLEALIARESSKRLARLGGTETKLRKIPRRRVTGVRNGSR